MRENPVVERTNVVEVVVVFLGKGHQELKKNINKFLDFEDFTFLFDKSSMKLKITVYM